MYDQDEFKRITGIDFEHIERNVIQYLMLKYDGISKNPKDWNEKRKTDKHFDKDVVDAARETIVSAINMIVDELQGSEDEVKKILTRFGVKSDKQITVEVLTEKKRNGTIHINFLEDGEVSILMLHIEYDGELFSSKAVLKKS